MGQDIYKFFKNSFQENKMRFKRQLKRRAVKKEEKDWKKHYFPYVWQQATELVKSPDKIERVIKKIKEKENG